MNPLVSIIIPCYNGENYIGQAIESVLNQTEQNFELLIVNDGSTDNSEKIINKYRKQDTRVKYIYQANSGVSVARNKGMENSTGEFIAFLDADDVWEKENLKTKINLLQSDAAVHWVFSGIYLADERLNKFMVLEAGSDENILEGLLSRSGDVINAPSNIILKRECIINTKIKFDPRLSTSADWDFCIQLAAQNFIGKRISKPLWTYRILNKSMSRNIQVLETDNLLVYKKWERKKIFNSFLFEAKCLSSIYLTLGGCWWVNGEDKIKGSYFVIKSILRYPPTILKILNKLIPYYLLPADNREHPKYKTIPVLSSASKKSSHIPSSSVASEALHIFLLHRIHPGHDPLWNPIHPELFSRVLSYLKKDFDFILLEDYLLNPFPKRKKKLCAITFDDGYKDYIDYALPILRKYQCPASMYVVTDCIEKNIPPWTYILNHAFIHTGHLHLDINTESFPKALKTTKWKNKDERVAFARKLSPYFKTITHGERINLYKEIIRQFNDIEFPTGLMLTWNEVKEIQHNNTAVGSHTVTHPLLSKKLFTGEELQYELKGSADIIREKTGNTPVSIAYPFGSYNEAAKQMASKAGYKFALTTIPYLYDKTKYDLFEIPRVELFNEPFIKSKLRMNGIIQKLNTLRYNYIGTSALLANEATRNIETLQENLPI